MISPGGLEGGGFIAVYRRPPVGPSRETARYRRTAPIPRQVRGFTLLEVIVAFVIAALALMELFRMTGGELRAVRVAGRYEEAVSRAQSHLAAVAPGGVLPVNEQQGDDGGGYHWRIDVALVGQAPIAAVGGVALVDQGPRAGLYTVTVAIAWQEDGKPRQVRLVTSRLAKLASRP